MKNIIEEEKKVSGFFSTRFYYAFRAFFIPITRILTWLRITPNTITFFSSVLALISGIYFAMDNLWTGLMFGYAGAFSDIVDGQLAKATGQTSKFGGILDSTIDRFNEFFIFTGLAVRYYFLEQPWWILACAVVFLNSVMTSYVKARAEADNFDCNVGLLQRPERLTLVAIAVAFNGLLLNPIIILLAILTFVTVLQRIIHVYKQAKQ